MSKLTERVVCPVCGNPTLFFHHGRIVCSNEECDFCHHCKGTCKSATPGGCDGPLGLPGINGKDGFETLVKIREISLRQHVTFPAYLAAMAEIRELCETFVPKD